MRLFPFLLVLLCIMPGCDNTRTINSLSSAPDNSRPGASLAPLTPAEDGRNLFVANCVGCHGRNADADTPAGRAWHVPNLHSPQVQSKTDEQLQHTIREGRGKMPPWGGLLSQTDIEHLLAYLRTFK